MYGGSSNTYGVPVPVPVPVPTPVRPASAVAPSRIVTATQATPLPVPLPVPAPSSPHVPANVASPAPPVPRPMAAPSPTPLAPPPSGFAVAVPSAHHGGAPVMAPSPAAPPPVPKLATTTATPMPVAVAPFAPVPQSQHVAASSLQPTAVAGGSAPWLRSSGSSPLPLASVPVATPLVSVLTPPAPMPIAVARPAVPKTVTFALPVERYEAPSPAPRVAAAMAPTATTAPAASSLFSVLHGLNMTASSTSPTASSLASHPTAAAAAPVVHPTPLTPARVLTSAATPVVPPLPLPVPTPTPSPTAAPKPSAGPSTAAPPAAVVVPTPSSAGASLTSAVVPSLSTAGAAAVPHVPPVPPPPSASASLLPLPTPTAPPLPSAAASLSTLNSTATALPVPSLPIPVGPARVFSLPVLHAAEEEPPTAVAQQLPSFVAETVPLTIPDYSTWLYPAVLHNAAPAKAEMKFPLAAVKTPHVLPAPSLLQWCEADVLATLPATLPPEYVIFGGARYSGAPLDLLRPPPPPRPEGKKTAAYLQSAEAQRLQFLLDQLDVAKNYLKIEARRMNEVRAASQGSASPTPPPPPTALSAGDDVLLKSAGETEELSKASIWTTAYFGTPQQVYSVLHTRKADGMLAAAGHVQYRRRQWGLKRSGETFVLGLGMKATALQFAAAAGKLDTVMLLLMNGAKDNAAPRLKEILSREAMDMVASICAPPRPRPARAPRAATAAEVAPSHDTPTSALATSFLNEQVMRLDDVPYMPSAAPPLYAPAFS